MLWTRLAPFPFQPLSGMPARAVAVDWEIAEDDKMQRVLRRGTAEARPEDGHSLHVIAEGLAPNRSMIGEAQERWLLDQFDKRDTAWTVLGNQVVMMQIRHKDPSQDIVNTDKWDGNAAARARLLQGAADRKVAGLVTVTGDIHRAIAGNLLVDFDQPKAMPVGVEFIATSISSDGDGGSGAKTRGELFAANAHLRHYDAHRGYLVCDFDQTRCQATYRTVDAVTKRGGKVTTAKTFTVEAKQPWLD